MILPFIQKWQLKLSNSVVSCYNKRKNKWVDEDIDNFQFGSFINNLRRKEPLCCKSPEMKTAVNDRAGIKTLSSGQELKCWSPSRSWNTVVRTGIKMLKLKQELKISTLFLRGSFGLEGKMNDERMISQIPTAHKFDEISSWCLADCSKYERERVSEEESVKESECGL